MQGSSKGCYSKPFILLKREPGKHRRKDIDLSGRYVFNRHYGENKRNVRHRIWPLYCTPNTELQIKKHCEKGKKKP
jgi:hypothetical protein